MELSQTQALLAIIGAILSFIYGAWRIGKAMGEFSTAQRGLTDEVQRGFNHVNSTLKRHSEHIHDLRNQQQIFAVEHAVIKQKIGIREVE